MALEATLILDSKEASAWLSGMSNRIDQITDHDRKVIGLLSAIVYRDLIDHFDQESGPSGPWKPWSDSYSRFMASLGKSGNKILQDTGRLRNAFKPTNVRNTSDGILWFNDATTPNGYPYAFGHNYGFGRVPQREFMWLSDGAMSEIEDTVLKFIQDGPESGS